MAAPAPRVSTKCEKDLYLFTQYSGQCWSDSSIAFLLFSEYIGPRVQEKLLLDQDILDNEFSDFINSNDDLLHFITRINVGIPDHILSTYTMSDEEKAEFIENATTYISCIKRRFMNWMRHQEERTQKIQRSALERCDSMAFSLCLEAAGAATSELLYPKKPENSDITAITKAGSFRRKASESNNLRSVGEKMENFRARDIEEREKLVKAGHGFSSTRGYETPRFGRFMALLISFFTDNSVTLVARATKGGSQTQDESWEKGDCIFVFQKDFGLLGADDTLNMDIFNELDSELLSASFVVGSKLLGLREGSHAFTFLECGGGFFVYDDNVKVLMPVDWRQLRNSVASYYIPPETIGMKSKLLSILGTEGRYSKLELDSDGYEKMSYNIAKSLDEIEDELSNKYNTVYKIQRFSYVILKQKPGADKIMANRGARNSANYPVVTPVMGNAPRLGGGKRRRKTLRRSLRRRKTYRKK